MSFDQHGRVAVVNEGVYTVLNDSSWISYVSAETDAILMTAVGANLHGDLYYGAPGSFGSVKPGLDGKLHAQPMLQEAPDWVRAAVFEDLIFLPQGIVFTSRAGLAFSGYESRNLQLLEIPKVSRIFARGSSVYVSCFDHPLQEFDFASNRLKPCVPTALDEEAIEFAVDVGNGLSLVSLLDDRLFLFDGSEARPWAGQKHPEINGSISSLKQLADGNIAVALIGEGVFVLNTAGDLLWSMTTPQFHRVSSMASNVPGVLWLVTEHAIEMVWYGGDLTTFDQRLGLAVSWPALALWKDRLYVASDGVLYEGQSRGVGHPTAFRRTVPQPPGGAWSLTSDGDHLLVGSVDGIYSQDTSGAYHLIGHVPDLAYLVMVDGGVCFAIGPTSCAMFELAGEKWIERSPRSPGLPGASVVHSFGKEAWIEMGPRGVARVSKKDDKMHVMHVPNEGWTNTRWVNVGHVDGTVVLSATRDQRRFYDQQSDAWCERPQLASMLSGSAHYLTRVRSDHKGEIWAAHFQGLVRFTPNPDGTYQETPIHFELINDRYPVVHILPNNDVWISASQSLCHVEPSAGQAHTSRGAPALVGMTDIRNNVELLASAPASTARPLRFAQNSLSFRFFAGTYTAYRNSHYEYQLKPEDPWSQLESGSVLRFSDLLEGDYRLKVRMGGPGSDANPALTIPFTIAPPWHRTVPAYLLFTASIAAAVYSAVRWSTDLTRRRNRVLERLVQDRTAALEETMKKLNEETRATATLAERDRVAGEIHDSVQQGLTGAILQLETTMKLSTVPDDLLARLGVVRNMVSYARQEVQHVVWDVESPLLEGNDLSAALEKLKSYIASDELTPSVRVTGKPIALSRQITHHLLRIAQEAATNALRHAQASSVEIHLEYLPQSIRLSITDNGHGFVPEQVLSKSGHFGLRGLRARARKLNAELHIESTPANGTIISVALRLTGTHSI